jgi:hypothetical protein
MNNDNNQTTRVKKYEDLRNEISKMDDKGQKEKKSSAKRNTISTTTTIPINNNEGIDTEAIEKTAPESKDTKVAAAPIFKSYQTKKIIITSLYILAAVGILCLVIALIVWMVNTL